MTARRRPVGSPIPAEVEAAIAARCSARHFEPGDVLMQLGDTDRTCYLIVAGDVLVTATSAQGSTVVLSRRGPGCLVGELAAIEGAPRSATVTARDRVETRVVPWRDLHDLLHLHPAWSVMLLGELSAQLRALTQRYALRSEDLRRRISELLATHLDETGDPVFRSSREELASWVGATREATTRTLQQMRDAGLVRLGRGTVELVDPAGLAH